MIIPFDAKFIQENFAYSINNRLAKAKTRNEKITIIMDIIGNLKQNGMKILIKTLAKILNVSKHLIRKALKLLDEKSLQVRIETRGRKKVEIKNPKLVSQIKEICESYEIQDKSIKDRIIYVNLTLRNIKAVLKEKYNYSDNDCPCENTIRRIMMKVLNYKITKVKKNKVFKKIEETDAIFKNVNEKMKYVKDSTNNTLAISIDDKVAKYVGNLSGGGYSWLVKETYDHDTNPDYIVKPFGIMNIKTKETFVYCTPSFSTADFKVDCIDDYLKKQLCLNKNINELIIFLDNGPENSSRRKLWLYRTINLSKKYSIKIELVYYPPYHSKYNKIEHYWGVLQRHWSGLVINSLDKLIGAINSTEFDNIPSTGILVEKKYQKGRKVDENKLKELTQKHITFANKGIEKWSLIVTP